MTPELEPSCNAWLPPPENTFEVISCAIKLALELLPEVFDLLHKGRMKASAMFNLVR